ncbi:MAG: putative Serine/threonine-protein kinase Nek3 [Streblomastix strix]|uniref:Putative Serine/threonine-protein kinase Nek3 n=1 Tax=Streblomastix strix TaxID=222440 RepID=A0A5J4W666_9EUKA|nr:MAG: putative Serine/threonine-protein kinase Nek3 [Streblomastix strix]
MQQTSSSISTYSSQNIRSLIGKYQIIRYLSKGDNVALVLAEDIESKMKFVIRIVSYKSPEDKKMAYAEDILLRQSQSKHTIQYIESFQIQDRFCFVMERYKHKTLRKMIDNAYSVKIILMNNNTQPEKTQHKAIDNTRLEKKKFLDGHQFKIFVGLIEALDTLHSMRYTHCDLKPENIFIQNDCTVKLGDFWMERKIKGQRYKKAIAAKCYAAPEVLGEHQAFTQASDIFSLGVICTELFQLEHPFEGDNIDQTIINIINDTKLKKFTNDTPEQAKILIQKMLNKDPSRRPTCKELLRDEYIAKYLRERQIEETNKELKEKKWVDEEMNNLIQVYNKTKNETPLIKIVLGFILAKRKHPIPSLTRIFSDDMPLNLKALLLIFAEQTGGDPISEKDKKWVNITYMQLLFHNVLLDFDMNKQNINGLKQTQSDVLLPPLPPLAYYSSSQEYIRRLKLIPKTQYDYKFEEFRNAVQTLIIMAPHMNREDLEMIVSEELLNALVPKNIIIADEDFGKAQLMPPTPANFYKIISRIKRKQKKIRMDKNLKSKMDQQKEIEQKETIQYDIGTEVQSIYDIDPDDINPFESKFHPENKKEEEVDEDEDGNITNQQLILIAKLIILYCFQNEREIQSEMDDLNTIDLQIEKKIEKRNAHRDAFRLRTLAPILSKILMQLQQEDIDHQEPVVIQLWQ